jgi:hypothetical protein
MSLQKYWPVAEEVNHCINHEAEGAHDAVLLAVHQPSPLTYRLISSDRKLEASEEELFQYLITNDVPSGAHLVPITGASGVGKSHMVRVLAARLQGINEDGHYVIIRIPKSASLRRVVSLILEKLPGEKYADVRAGFSKAVSEVNIDSAVISFQSQLTISLIELAKELKVQVTANPANTSLKEQYGHAINLPKFMGDPVLVDYFRDHVFPRIVNRAVSGQSQPEQEESVEDFRAEDFNLPESIDINRAAEPTKSYYLRSLQIRDGEGKRSATRLLNETNVVDQAIRQLFKLHESLGGMTLQEVILEIRRLLLTQNRELVILVEDFKALTGIQDTLLNVLIQEGVRDGVRELATMRSVIAVTDGYLAGKDTIATRAKREWVVESNLSSDEEVLRRTKGLVSSYLNAARWGYSELVRQFEQRGNTWSGARSRVDVYADENSDPDTTILTAFGRNNGIPLFPYTDLAIEQLARNALTRHNKLVFTPRFIIDSVLRDVLLSGRLAFENGLFPNSGIDAPRVNAEVTQWLSALPVSEEVRNRYARVVAIWGNLPQTPAEIGRIPKEVFDAFKLDRPNVLPIGPVPPISLAPPIPPIGGKGTGINQSPPPPSPSPSPPPPSPSLDDDLKLALENWVQKNEQLKNTVANQIRQSIASALNERIDMQAERCVKALISARQISIPNAAGEGNISSTPIKVADDHSDRTGQLRSELAAVVRFYRPNGENGSYVGADDDKVWIGNLSDRLMPQALALVRTTIRLKLGVALRQLATNSRILGLADRGRTAASLAPFLFGATVALKPSVEGAPQEFSAWRSLQEQALRVRPELTQIVLSYCGSFQGAGKTAYAVDMARVVDCMPPDGEAVDLRLLDPLADELRQTLIAMGEARVRVQARNVLQSATSIRTKLTAELGGEFDKQAIADEFKTLADQLRGTGEWNTEEIGMGHPAFRTLCEDFRSSALQEALAMLGKTEEGDGQEEAKGDAQLINRMGRFDVQPLIVATRFVETSRKVLKVSDKRAKMLEEQFRGVDPLAEAQRIQSLFTGLLQEIDSLGLKGEAACS